ncbi:magnesium transporter CorA family protein [uncultured Friedmanniella sp.]|uniref:magnesium transporter CorA family protein n=1 Tax=uncultured Friedmanniella sp. TaxID=335381 RepID=UPI0035CC5650
MSTALSATPEQASGPVPLSRVWSRGKVIAEDLTGENLSDVLQHNSDASAWWVLPRDPDYGAAELRGVAQALDLDDLAIRDLLAEDRRAKFEAIGGARLVITNYVSVDTRQRAVTIHPISVIATDRALICLVAEGEFKPGRLLQQRAHDLAEGGVEAGLQLLLAAVIHTYEDAAQWLEDAADSLSDVLFDQERALAKDEQLEAFRLRTALSQLRRSTEPMRTVMDDLVEEPLPAAKGKRIPAATSARQWRVLSERHTRAANAADALREVLSSVFDTSLALADLRMNLIMKQLSGWAAIIAVPTLVTGFVGMNVSFPLDGTSTGFWVAMVIMVVSSVILYLGFRRRGWI